MPMPDGLLPPRMRGDALDRQVNFDQSFGIGARSWSVCTIFRDMDQDFYTFAHQIISATLQNLLKDSRGPEV